MRTESRVYYNCHFASWPEVKVSEEGKRMMSKSERYLFWPIQSMAGAMKQFLIPLTSLVPSQRPSQSAPDHRFRQDDRVWIDWLRIQMDVCHNTTLRGKVFAFPNAERRNHATPDYPYMMVYPKVRDGTVPTMPTELNLYGLSKAKLIGQSNERRQIGNTDGPFAYVRNNSGNLCWKASDGEAYTAVMSRSEGQAVGDISLRIDSGPVKKKGTVLVYDLAVNGHQGDNQRYHHLDFFIRIGKWQKFKNPGNSLVEGENPLEIFFFLDAPGAVNRVDDMEDENMVDAPCKITGLTLEACFRC